MATNPVPTLTLPKAPSMPTSTGAPSSHAGLTQRKVPVHRQSGVLMETRWVKPGGPDGGASAIPGGVGKLPPLPAPHGFPTPNHPANHTSATSTGSDSLAARVGASKGSFAPKKGFCHMTGHAAPLPTGHGAYDKLRHIPTGALVKRAKSALQSGKVKTFVHHAAHHVARALHGGADAATYGAFVGHHYGKEGLKHASHIAVAAVGHHAARLKSLSQHGVDNALAHLHSFGHDPLVHIGHAALAHHEKKHAHISEQYHKAREQHLAMLHEATKQHKGFHDAAVEHTNARAALRDTPADQLTDAHHERVHNSLRNMKKELLRAGKLGHVNRSLDHMNKLRAQVEHHVESHKDLSGQMERYHDRVLDHLESRGAHA